MKKTTLLTALCVIAVVATPMAAQARPHHSHNNTFFSHFHKSFFHFLLPFNTMIPQLRKKWEIFLKFMHFFVDPEKGL